MGNQLPEFLPTETRDSVSDLISHARHMLGRKGKAIRATTSSKLRSKRIKQGTFEVMEFTMWTTASLSE